MESEFPKNLSSCHRLKSEVWDSKEKMAPILRVKPEKLAAVLIFQEKKLSYQRSSDGAVPAVQFGRSTDKIVPADFAGAGKTGIAFWRESTGKWFIIRSEDSSFYAILFG